MVFLGLLVLLGLGLHCGLRFCGVCIDTSAAMVAMVAALPDDIDSGNSPTVVPSVEGGVAYVAVLSLEAGWAQKTAIVTNSGLGVSARPCIRLADGVFDVSEDSKGLWIAVVFHGVSCGVVSVVSY